MGRDTTACFILIADCDADDDLLHGGLDRCVFTFVDAIARRRQQISTPSRGVLKVFVLVGFYIEAWPLSCFNFNFGTDAGPKRSRNDDGTLRYRCCHRWDVACHGEHRHNLRAASALVGREIFEGTWF